MGRTPTPQTMSLGHGGTVGRVRVWTIETEGEVGGEIGGDKEREHALTMEKIDENNIQQMIVRDQLSTSSIVSIKRILFKQLKLGTEPCGLCYFNYTIYAHESKAYLHFDKIYDLLSSSN
jgi:hypothetical protein